MPVTSETVKKAYRRDAPFYDLVFGALFHPGRKTAVEHLHCVPGDRVLEVGVGTGLSLGMYPTNIKVVGIDLSKHMLERAERKAAEENYPHAEALLQMDAQQMSFPDNSFDFIYVDGYAHTGEEGGRTLIDWYAKLKPGGIMAGDDYDAQKWPLVVWAVHHLVAQLGLPLKVTDQVQDAAYNKYRSWFFTKPMEPAAVTLTPSPALMNLGDMEKATKAEERKKRQAARKAQR